MHLADAADTKAVAPKREDRRGTGCGKRATSVRLMPVINLSDDGPLSGCAVSACLICSIGIKSGRYGEPCFQDHIGIGIA